MKPSLKASFVRHRIDTCIQSDRMGFAIEPEKFSLLTPHKLAIFIECLGRDYTASMLHLFSPTQFSV